MNWNGQQKKDILSFLYFLIRCIKTLVDSPGDTNPLIDIIYNLRIHLKRIFTNVD